MFEAISAGFVPVIIIVGIALILTCIIAFLVTNLPDWLSFPIVIGSIVILLSYAIGKQEIHTKNRVIAIENSTDRVIEKIDSIRGMVDSLN